MSSCGLLSLVVLETHHEQAHTAAVRPLRAGYEMPAKEVEQATLVKCRRARPPSHF
jgi:hypothetical protein